MSGVWKARGNCNQSSPEAPRVNDEFPFIDAELLAGKKARNLLCFCKGFAIFCYMGLKEKQINFRPSEDGLALIDGLAGHFGISRSAVIELAVRRLAQHEQMLQSVLPGDISNLTLGRAEMSQPRKVSQKAKKRK